MSPSTSPRTAVPHTDARRSVSRRSVARSAAWAAPAIMAVSAAPSASASPRTAPTGCATLVWTNTTLSGTQGYNAQRTATLTLPNGSTATVTVSQQRLSGLPGRQVDAGATSPTPSYGDFSATPAGSQQAWANHFTNHQGRLYAVTGGTTSVLTLNQGTTGPSQGTARAAETVTFSFTDAAGTPIKASSIFFNAYDITSQQSNMNNAAYYTDSLTFSGTAMKASGAVGQPNSYNITSTTLSSYGQNVSTNTGNYIGVYLTPTSNTVSMTYNNASQTPLISNSNYQFIGIGDATICF